METQGGRNDTRNNMHFVSARESVTISRIANESPQMMGVVHYDEISLFKTRSYVVNGRLYICIGHSAACVKEKKGGQVVSAAMGYSFIPELTDKNGGKKS
jgi:hypothetical protein